MVGSTAERARLGTTWCVQTCNGNAYQLNVVWLRKKCKWHRAIGPSVMVHLSVFLSLSPGPVPPPVDLYVWILSLSLSPPVPCLHLLSLSLFSVSLGLFSLLRDHLSSVLYPHHRFFNYPFSSLCGLPADWSSVAREYDLLLWEGGGNLFTNRLSNEQYFTTVRTSGCQSFPTPPVFLRQDTDWS